MCSIQLLPMFKNCWPFEGMPETHRLTPLQISDTEPDWVEAEFGDLRIVHAEYYSRRCGPDGWCATGYGWLPAAGSNWKLIKEAYRDSRQPSMFE